jgi:hypothetical protein
MATTFLEPGGDATFNVTLTTNNGFWSAVNLSPAVATDFVHGSHQKSIKYRASFADYLTAPIGSLTGAGSRLSLYIYLVALPGATSVICAATDGTSGGVEFKLTSAGVLQLARWDTDAQIGSNGPTLTTGKWYRISLAYTITSTVVNRFEVFVDGASAISVTNATIGAATVTALKVGNLSGNASLDMRSSDHYTDNSSSLIDTSNIWVTAKRPNANGTTNGFTTQIGSGGSGYGTGHSPQVNERPLSITNGWSIIGAGSAVTEEYNIEGKSTGDIDISLTTILDYMGWVSASSAVSETAQIIVNGVASNISLVNVSGIFTNYAGSAVYPSGGADIGIITATTVTTVSLYECGIVVAYIPPPTGYASWASQTISNPLIGNDIQVV